MHFDPSAQANWSEEQESESEEAREPLVRGGTELKLSITSHF